MQQVADWDAQWRIEPSDPRAPDAEERTPRWRAQERLVRERCGGFGGLTVVELGAGRGLNALLYARRGAQVTLLDTSRLVLDQARGLFAEHGLEPELAEADVFALFLRYLFVRLRAARRLGRALAAARDPLAARLRPLAWGLTATLAGTMAANAFYLTMQFYYFYFVAILVLALPVVFGRPAAARA